MNTEAIVKMLDGEKCKLLNRKECTVATNGYVIVVTDGVDGILRYDEGDKDEMNFNSVEEFFKTHVGDTEFEIAVDVDFLRTAIALVDEIGGGEIAIRKVKSNRQNIGYLEISGDHTSVLISPRRSDFEYKSTKKKFLELTDKKDFIDSGLNI